jgi:UDP-N-acetylglucosamine 3-dehydrogenase
LGRKGGWRVSTLGIGLIGCGGMGRSLTRQLVTIDSARLVAVMDVSEEAARAVGEEYSVPFVTTPDALIARPDVDAVIVASPGFLHRAQTELAAAHGKHVFVEKPMATNVADCEGMIAAAESGGITLMVGQVLRYYPCWSKCLEIVRSGEIGSPVGVAVTRISPGWGGWAAAWRNSLEQSGGLLMEVNAHEIDFMCQVGGDVTRVYAEADRYCDDPADYPNLYFVSLRFASGAVGLLHASTVTALSDLSGKIQGDEGTLIYTSGFGTGGEIRVAKRDGEPRSIPIGEIEVEQPVRKELRLFVESVLNGTPPPITPREGMRNVAVAAAAYQSARAGRSVEL